MATQPSSRFAIHSTNDLRAHVADGQSLADHVIHDADLTAVDIEATDVSGAIIVGCTLTPELRHDLVDRGAAVLPGFEELPYEPHRRGLYTSGELLEGYEEDGYTGTHDFEVYTHFDRARRTYGSLPPLHESLAQTLHDHAIDDALHRFAETHRPERIVGIMGGHSTGRDAYDFENVVRLCRELTRRGFIVATGGGPGIMEAGNLGAYLANYEDDAIVEHILGVLGEAPTFAKPSDEGTPKYLEDIRHYITAGYNARSVADAPETRERFCANGPPGVSLAVPTWFYGHEPSNLFCDNIAKYFSNGLREDVLLAISRAGVVFAPGSAGTMQEVFMDLAQNHYATFVDRSVMAFMGDERFLLKSYDLVRDFACAKDSNGDYQDMIGRFSNFSDVADFIEANPPRPRDLKPPLYELM